MLWLCFSLPALPMEIFSRGSCAPANAEPLVVTIGEGRTQSVLMANALAQRGGIRSGMSLAAAHALMAPLQVRARDECAERAALERLAAWAGQFTSHVAIASTREVLLEVAGSLRLFNGLTALCQTVRHGVTELGYAVTLGVAPTPLAATWLARAGEEKPVVDLRALAGRLFAMPLTCIDLTDDQCEVLHGIGLRTVGECLRLPRDGLTRRLGTDFVRALDRAFGRVADPRKFYVAPPRFEARLTLPSAVEEAERVLFPLHRLLRELVGFLTARVVGVQQLELRLYHHKAPVTKLDVGLARATRNPRHLGEIFRESLTRVELAEPVEEIVLTAPTLIPLADSATDFFESKLAKPEAAAELIERLSSRLGRDAVRGVHIVADHRPEHAWRYVEPGALVQDVSAASNLSEVGEIGEIARNRPLWLLRDPVPLDVRDGQPHLDGILELKPDRERIESGWWDGGDVRRDYFIARHIAGAWLWVYRELSGKGAWWMQGVFA